MQYGLGAGIFTLWFFTAFGSGIAIFFWRTCLCVTLGYGLIALAGLVERNLEKEIDAVRLDLSRARGQAFSPPYPESTEWLNGLIKLVWGLIDPANFIPMADMIEDILQQSLPSFVDAVRITDVGQGTNPLRITSIRALPDQPGDHGYPRTDWIDQGEGLDLKDPGGKKIDEDQAGDYYNFEVAFSYAALPGQAATERAKNIHMLVEFFLGAYDWFHVPVPIWIQIEEILGVVRLRCQFIPQPP
jgi:Ca2+-dependent lipid-binding protein